jgi:hypothetical protein
MKELKEEAKRQHEHKLHAYGGKCRANGGRAEHSDVKEDEALIKKEVKPAALKHPAHKADGGPIMGGSRMPSLGRNRRVGSAKGKGKGKTNVNVIVAGGKPGGDAGPGATPMPPAAGPAMPPPRPAMPPIPPRPIGAAPGAGPMKRGGKIKKHDEHHKGAHH